MAHRERSSDSSRNQDIRYYAKTQNAVNSYKRFTEQELLLIRQHKIPDHELSKMLQRSVKSIQVIRSKMKRQDETKVINNT